MNIAPFGNIDKDDLKEYYSAEIDVSNSRIDLDLSFESESVNESILKAAADFVSNIEIMASKAFSAISEDYDLDEESETARFYLQHHNR